MGYLFFMTERFWTSYCWSASSAGCYYFLQKVLQQIEKVSCWCHESWPSPKLEVSIFRISVARCSVLMQTRGHTYYYLARTINCGDLGAKSLFYPPINVVVLVSRGGKRTRYEDWQLFRGFLRQVLRRARRSNCTLQPAAWAPWTRKKKNLETKKKVPSRKLHRWKQHDVGCCSVMQFPRDQQASFLS